jgi:FkbM family methyltransferase
LRITLAASRLSGVDTFPEGVGARRRMAVLHIHPRNIGGHSILNSARSRKHAVINLVDLRTVLDRTPRGTCDLLKCDCEGAEHEIISSIDKNLAARISRIVYEDTPGLDSWGLKSHLVAQGYEVKPYGDLILATRR